MSRCLAFSDSVRDLSRCFLSTEHFFSMDYISAYRSLVRKDSA